VKRRTETNYRNWATFFRAVQWALQPVADRRGLLLFSSAGLDELGAPLYGIIIYLQCQIAALRSNAEKQRFKLHIVSAGCTSLVRGCPAQISPRFVRALPWRELVVM
jgi:hypothetical protein